MMMNDPTQIPFDLAHRETFAREDLVIGRSNRAAVDLVESWPNWPSHVAILIGPPGSGKTHLAAIWANSSAALLLPQEKLDDRVAGLTGNESILVELARGVPVPDKALFHLINLLGTNGGSLLLTSRKAPNLWPVELPDLRSRLLAAACVFIEEPDDALLSAVITKQFADRQIEIQPHVVTFLLARMERSLTAAARLVERLDKLALARKTRITRQLAAEILFKPQ